MWWSLVSFYTCADSLHWESSKLQNSLCKCFWRLCYLIMRILCLSPESLRTFTPVLAFTWRSLCRFQSFTKRILCVYRSRFGVVRSYYGERSCFMHGACPNLLEFGSSTFSSRKIFLKASDTLRSSFIQFLTWIFCYEPEANEFCWFCASLFTCQ